MVARNGGWHRWLVREEARAVVADCLYERGGKGKLVIRRKKWEEKIKGKREKKIKEERKEKIGRASCRERVLELV